MSPLPPRPCPCLARCYREFPVDWMTRHLIESGFVCTPEHIKSFSILHSVDSLLRQVKVAESKLVSISNVPLREGMRIYLEELKQRVRAECDRQENGRIPYSFDYVMCATIL